MRPHKLCNHLFDTAVAYSAFWEQVPILQAPDETLKHSRLALSALTSRVISGGLGLLGIEAPKRL
jgi:arginyl-tRNA synthetase